LPESPSIPKKLRATELKRVDLVFNPWKGSWVTLLVSLSCSASSLASGKERRGEIILCDLGINPLVGLEASEGPKFPLVPMRDVMQTPSLPVLRSLMTLYIHPSWLQMLKKWVK